MGMYSAVRRFLQLFITLFSSSRRQRYSNFENLCMSVRLRLPTMPTSVFQGQGPYAAKLKDVEKDIKDIQKRINEKLGQPRTNALSCSSNHFRRSKGIGHRSGFSKSLGFGRGPATNGRRTSLASRTLHKDHSSGS